MNVEGTVPEVWQVKKIHAQGRARFWHDKGTKLWWGTLVDENEKPIHNLVWAYQDHEVTWMLSCITDKLAVEHNMQADRVLPTLKALPIVGKPIHKHDCNCCTFLGNSKDEQYDFDLYYCPQGGMPTLIARFGENGDYVSGMSFADTIPVLGEAKERAIKLNLI